MTRTSHISAQLGGLPSMEERADLVQHIPDAGN